MEGDKSDTGQICIGGYSYNKGKLHTSKFMCPSAEPNTGGTYGWRYAQNHYITARSGRTSGKFASPINISECNFPYALMVFSEISADTTYSINFKTTEEELGFRHQGSNVLHGDWHVEFWSKDAFPRNAKQGSATYSGSFFYHLNTTGLPY